MRRIQNNSANSEDDRPSALTKVEWKRVVEVFQLSPQQVKVVALILEGKRDKQIAAEVNLSIWTVRSHITRVFVKTEVSDRIELVLRAFEIARRPQSE